MNLRENIHARVPNQSPKKPQCLSQITQTPPQTTNPKTTQTPTCLSLRNNTACCIPLRNLRYLRENIHIRVLNLSSKKPQCLSQITQTPHKTTNPKTTQTPTCLSLRNNTACCIPLRDQRHLRENKYASLLNQSPKKEPQCLPQISQIYADETQNHTNSKLSFSAK